MRVSELYYLDSDSDSGSEIEEIVTANERHRQAFAEIDAIADQLPPQELLRLYQQAQMREMGRRAMAQREAAFFMSLYYRRKSYILLLHLS